MYRKFIFINYMINKILCILLLLLFIILLIKLYEKINIYKINNTNRTLKLYDTNPNNNSNNVEHFKQNAWTTDKDVLVAEEQSLNDIQKEEVKNMINQLGKEQLKTLIAQQSPLLTGPVGPVGPQGPAGTTLVSSGRLVNKVGSFSKNSNKDKKMIFISDDKYRDNLLKIITVLEVICLWKSECRLNGIRIHGFYPVSKVIGRTHNFPISTCCS